MLAQQSQATIQIPSNFIAELEASICRDSFYHFVKMSWHVVFPHELFVDGKHIQLMCEELEACYYGRQTRLIINIPPRHAKSSLLNIFFPAWVWTRSPEKKFICTSHSEKLTSRDSLLCRLLITSNWYRERFSVRLNKDQAEKLNFMNTAMGFRKGFGLKGIGGEGGDYILIDDPLDMEDALSEAEREAANNVMDSVIPTRLNNPKTACIIMIMQRLHEDDPAGHVLAKGGWEQLVLPAEYEGERFVSSLGFKDFRTEIGQLLWEERFGRKEIDDLKIALGSDYLIASQLQQRPTPLAGNIFKREWFENRRIPNDTRGIYLSVDTAFVNTEGSAKSAIVVFALDAYNFLIPVFAWSDKLEFPQLVRQIVKVAEMYPENLLYGVVIEEKGSGISALQTIRQTTPLAFAKKLYPFRPPASLKKEERARVASKWVENGQVALPPMTDENKSWLVPLEEELYSAPNGEYMDMVDCVVQIIFKLESHLAAGLRARLKAGYHGN